MDSHVVVLGAGYSGLAAAQLAARQTGARVTLVNARDRFVERVRLHQLASGQRLRHLSLAEVLDGTGVDLVVDTVTGIDPAARMVRLAGRPELLDYDILIYALGSHADLDLVPGAAEHAYTVAGFEEAGRLRARLPGTGVVAVVGGGLTGIEAATELAESHPELKVRMITDGALGAALSQRGQRYLRRVFRRLGIEVDENVRVKEVRADGVVLDDDVHVLAGAVVWTTGFRVPEVAGEAGFACDVNGRMLVDGTLRSVSHPEVYAIGDAAVMHNVAGEELRMACATGLPAGARVAESVTDHLAGREAKPLRFRYVNQCISLGRKAGLIQFVRADDSPVEAILTGRLAAMYKEAIVKGAFAAGRRPGLAKLAA